MAVERIPNFNRIINLQFYSKINGSEYRELPELSIICQKKGRKPAIEITGSFTTDDCLPAFNVTIKNLYMNVPDFTYPKIKVTAGYENELQAFEGSILTMYKEAPGPEGRTLIQCITGEAGAWLTETVTLQYSEGFKLTDALAKIAKSLNLKVISSSTIKAMTSKAPLEFEGRPQEALQKLKNIFYKERVVLTVRADELRAYTLDDSEGINEYRLNYLSTPPQHTPGDEGIIYTTLVAPWIPTLRPGDKVSYASNEIMKSFNVSRSKETKLIVDNIQFHFGTVGSVNQMTIQGHAV